MEAQLRAKLASADEGVQCGRMGRAREPALTHRVMAKIQKEGAEPPPSVGWPSNVQPSMNGNVPRRLAPSGDRYPRRGARYRGPPTECQWLAGAPWEWASAPVRDAERYEEMRKRSAHDP